MSENGEIFTAGKNFTLPPAVTALTNSNSATDKPEWRHTLLYYDLANTVDQVRDKDKDKETNNTSGLCFSTS